jgi:hypothetical protein
MIPTSLVFSYHLDLVCLNLDQDKFIGEVNCCVDFGDDHDEVTIPSVWDQSIYIIYDKKDATGHS